MTRVLAYNLTMAKMQWSNILMHHCPTCGDSFFFRPDSDVYECMQIHECDFFIGKKKLKELQQKIAIRQLKK